MPVKLRRGPLAWAIAIAGIAILMVLPGILVRAQTAPEKLSFEVASIKQATAGESTPASFPMDYGDFFGVTNPHGRFVEQAPVSVYIGFAYKLWPSKDLRDAMLAGLPKWVATDQYVINAQAEGSPTKDQIRLMVQSLLADRFKLVVHFERQETPVLALVVDNPGKTGAKLKPHSDIVPCDVSKVSGDVLVPPCYLVQAITKPNSSFLMAGRNLTMNQIAATLSQLSVDFAHPVVDQTGLSGRFDFSLEWTRQTSNSVTPEPGTSMQDALQEQLGLKLKSTKALMNILVIDHVERPSEN